MELLIIVSTPQSGQIAKGLGEAALRTGITWGVFLTNDGVCILSDQALVETLSKATHAIACKDSWEHYMGESECPVELGSQTNNSELAGEAKRIVSL